MSPGTRTVVWVTLGVAAAIGLVVVLYAQGLLPVAGVFAAMVLGPAIGFWRIGWLARRRRIASGAVVERLQGMVAALDAERRTDPGQRRSGAATADLLDAQELVDGAVQRFAWGDEAGAAQRVSALAALPGARAWQDSPLVRSIAGLEAPLADLERVVGRLEAESARRAQER